MTRRAALAFGIDVIAIALFVVIGRRNHHETGNGLIGVLRIAAPFLIALIVGWLVAARIMTGADRSPMAIRSGLLIWTCTVVIGLALRRLVFQRGIAIAFIIVTTITLGVLLIGWRAIARVMTRADRARPV
jgi:Protein of unknown function (DUF3054)